eukprot:gene1791-2926_t
MLYGRHRRHDRRAAAREPPWPTSFGGGFRFCRVVVSADRFGGESAELAPGRGGNARAGLRGCSEWAGLRDGPRELLSDWVSPPPTAPVFAAAWPGPPLCVGPILAVALYLAWGRMNHRMSHRHHSAAHEWLAHHHAVPAGSTRQAEPQQHHRGNADTTNTRAGGLARQRIPHAPVLAACPGDGPSGKEKYSLLHQTLSFMRPYDVCNRKARWGSQDDDGGWIVCLDTWGNATVAYTYTSVLSGDRGFLYGIANDNTFERQVATDLGIYVHQHDPTMKSSLLYKDGKEENAPRLSRQPEHLLGWHFECLGKPGSKLLDKWPCNTPEGHMRANGDLGKQVILKMDAEGGEWSGLDDVSDAALSKVTQLFLEIHIFDWDNLHWALSLLRRMHQFFYLHHIHINNVEPPRLFWGDTVGVHKFYELSYIRRDLVEQRQPADDCAIPRPVLPSKDLDKHTCSWCPDKNYAHTLVARTWPYVSWNNSVDFAELDPD